MSGSWYPCRKWSDSRGILYQIGVKDFNELIQDVWSLLYLCHTCWGTYYSGSSDLSAILSNLLILFSNDHRCTCILFYKVISGKSQNNLCSGCQRFLGGTFYGQKGTYFLWPVRGPYLVLLFYRENNFLTQ